jgi:MoaA/NifB/PqqE/SkfB family radical SAM enzyme
VQAGARALLQRVDWLLVRGVKTLHFCGGEPTLHPALPELLDRVRAQGRTSKLTTNAIRLSDELLLALRAQRTEVKVSLHGDRAQHDRIVGRDAFEATTANLRRLLAAGVRTSLQTTVVAGHAWVVEWVAAFGLELGVRQLSICLSCPAATDGTAAPSTSSARASARP